MEKLQAHPNLCRRRKDELRSAVKTFVQRFEPAGMGTVIVPRATVRKATVIAPARMPNARTRPVRRATGRRSADRAAMAAAMAMAVVAASAVAVAAALPEGNA